MLHRLEMQEKAEEKAVIMGLSPYVDNASPEARIEQGLKPFMSHAMYNANAPTQDRLLAAKGTSGEFFAAVFDGHGRIYGSMIEKK